MAQETGKRSTTVVILGVVVALGLLAAVCFGCIGGFTFFGWGVFKDQAQSSLNANPVVAEHVGVIESMDLDLIASGNAEGDETFVFRVKGTKGNAVITATLVAADDAEALQSGSMELPDGTVLDLFENDGPPEER